MERLSWRWKTPHQMKHLPCCLSLVSSRVISPSTAGPYLSPALHILSHSFCSSCALRKKLMLEQRFCSTKCQVLLLNARRPPAPSHCPCTTALHFSTETTGFWKTPSSHLLPVRGSLVTYKISPFSMQTVTATLTLQSLQQQTLATTNLLNLVSLCNWVVTPASIQKQLLLY